MFITTAYEYSNKYPDANRAIQMIAVSPSGEIYSAYFDGNYDKPMMGAFITSYVYVNSWSVTVKEIIIER